MLDARVVLLTVGGAAVAARSTVLCVQARCSGYHGWALACSVVGLITGCVLLLLLRFRADAGTALLPPASAALSIWWALGAGVMTFKSPYRETGNGYFGAWAALSASWLLTVEHYPQLQAPFRRLVREAGQQWLATLIIASLVVLVQTVVGFKKWSGEVGWIFACSLFSLAVCVASVFYSEKLGRSWRFVAAFLFLWWTIGCGVATFRAPYTATGNGFFGSWAAWASATMLCAAAFFVHPDAAPSASAFGVVRGAVYAAMDRLNTRMEIFGAWVASLVVVIAAGVPCHSGRCAGYLAWAVACSAMGFAALTVLIVCMKCGWGASAIERHLMPMAAALLLLWFVGACCMTFKGPFREAGNGFFGAWSAVACLFMLAAQSSGLLGGLLQGLENRGRELLLVAVASAVVFVQAATDCGETKDCARQRGWALACGLVGMAACGAAAAAAARGGALHRWLPVALTVWWVAGVAVLTFDAPYPDAGNAYFAAWAALAGSALLAARRFGVWPPPPAAELAPDGGDGDGERESIGGSAGRASGTFDHTPAGPTLEPLPHASGPGTSVV